MTEPREDAGASALLAALTTEHFVLQGVRSAGSSEAASRSALYLATVSSAMIALGFVSRSDALVAAFLGAAVPLVLVLGVLTHLRLVTLGVQDLARLRDVQRIKAYYAGLTPNASAFFPTIDPDDGRALVSSMGYRPGPAQLLLTAAAPVAIINAVIAGIGAAIALSGAWPLAPAVGAGVLVAIAGVLAALRYQWVANRRAFPG